MTFYELYKKIDEKFPSSLSCDWDNDGIMCAPNLEKQVKKILISLDITDAVVEYAVKNGFDTIISHHPLVFKGQKSISPLNYTQSKLIKLIKNDVNAISFHTRLDAGEGGVNDTLAKVLSLKIVENDPKDPIGRICEIEKAEDLESFALKVKSLLNAPFVSFVGKKNVKRVYLCGGDGKDLIPNAVSCGADTLVTGNASYNSMLDAEEMGLNVIEAGHFYTENPVCTTLENIVKDVISSVEVEIYNSNKIKTIL